MWVSSHDSVEVRETETETERERERERERGKKLANHARVTWSQRRTWLLQFGSIPGSKLTRRERR